MHIRNIITSVLLLTLVACNADNQQAKNQQVKNASIADMEVADSGAVFAVVGDYGTDSSNEANVANMVNTFFSELSGAGELFVVSVGDNNYTLNDSDADLEVLYSAFNATVCESQNNHGKFYRDFLPNGQCPDLANLPPPPARGDACTDYDGNVVDISNVNFYPVPGNEDYHAPGNTQYVGNLDGYNGYFRWARQGCAVNSCNNTTEQWVENELGISGFQCSEVPQNSYDVIRGDNHLFFLDTSWLVNKTCDPVQNGGFSPAVCYDNDDFQNLSSDQKSLCAQGFWLEWAANQSADNAIKLAFMHHSPFSSSNHGSCGAVQYNFREFGINSVFSGHSHVYERVTISTEENKDSYLYFISGSGGYNNNLNDVCDNSYSVGEPYFPGANGEELIVNNVTGYNGNGNKHGYGAIFVYAPPAADVENAGSLKSLFYDANATAKEDYVDACGVNPVFDDCVSNSNYDVQSCAVD